MWAMLLVALGADPQYGLSTGGRASPPRGPSCEATRAPPDKHCATDVDCVVLRQRVGCCGTLVIRAVNRKDVPRLEEEARVCATARCKCAPAPTTLDDGTPAEGNPRVSAICRQSRCSPVLQPLPEPAPAPRAGLTSAQAAKLPQCAPDQCGPAPLYPTAVCADGVSVGGRGPCVQLAGRCAWAHLVCPD